MRRHRNDAHVPVVVAPRLVVRADGHQARVLAAGAWWEGRLAGCCCLVGVGMEGGCGNKEAGRHGCSVPPKRQPKLQPNATIRPALKPTRVGLQADSIKAGDGGQLLRQVLQGKERIRHAAGLLGVMMETVLHQL